MDLFLYKASIKELETCKTVSKLEELVKKYSNFITASELGHGIKNNIDNSISIFYYKLFSLSLKLFAKRSKKRLPDFIYKNHRNAQEHFLTSIFEHGRKEHEYKKRLFFDHSPTYEELMGWFEYDNNICMPTSFWYLEKLNKIIDNNPIHFTITFNYKIHEFEHCSTKLPDRHQKLTYAIRHKQVNFPNKPQTVWDLFIERCSKQIYKIVNQSFVDEQIIKLEQQVTALKALGKYCNVQQ